MRISKTYKISGTIHNMAGKCEKYLVIAAFVMTGIKFLSAFAMDRSSKNYKTNINKR